MSKPNKTIHVLIVALAAFSGAAVAGGGMSGGATEATQILNNLQLLKIALDEAVTAKKTVEQYSTQVKQFDLEKLNIRGMDSLPVGLGTDVLKARNDLSNYKQALTNLEGSLSRQAAAIEQRVTEARLSGKDWNSYVQSVAADAATNQRRAVERLKYEESVMQQVQSDYEFARNLQSQIPATVGQHQSIQMLNSQMNRVITQNGKLLEVVSSSIRKQADEDAAKAESATKSLADRELLRQRQDAIERRQRAFGGLPQ